MSSEDEAMDIGSGPDIPDWFVKWYQDPRPDMAQTQLDAWHDNISQLHQLLPSFGRRYSAQEVLAILYEGSGWVTQYSVDPKHGSLDPEYSINPKKHTISFKQFLPYLIRIVDPKHKSTFEEFEQPLVTFLGLPSIGKKRKKLRIYSVESEKPRFGVSSSVPYLPNSDFTILANTSGKLKTSRGPYTPNRISARSRDVKAYFKTLALRTGGRGGSDTKTNHWSQGLDADQILRVQDHLQRSLQEATLAGMPSKRTARDTQARRTLCQLLGAAVPEAGTDTESSPLYVAMLGILEAIRIANADAIGRPLRLTRSEKQAVASLLVQACENQSGADQLYNTALQRVALQLSLPPYSPRVLHELQAAGLLV
jgi:hypothetical protein